MNADDRTHVYRKISDESHNQYVANGSPAHSPTKSAPSSLMVSLPDDTIHTVREHHQYVEHRVSGVLGQPMYSRCGFILYCGDACELLSALADTGLQIDLSITSPPYNIGKEYEVPMPLDEYLNWCGTWMTKLHAVTSNTGAFWLNVGYLEVPGRGLCVPIPYLLWDRSPFYLLQEVVWRYGAGVSAKRRLSPRNEKWMFYVSDQKTYTFNVDDIRDSNVKYPHQKKNGKYRCNPLGKNPSDVWDFSKVTTGANRSSRERTSHPAQFPLPVVERVVRASSNATDLVLDPFAGSCSAGIAAVGLGRVFLGFEVRADYCSMAIERFERFWEERTSLQKQKTLF